MRGSGWIALALAVAACGPEPPAPAPGVESDAVDATAKAAAGLVPSRFHGRWNSDPVACRREGGEMRLEIGPQALRFHESVARVEAVRTGGDGSVALDLAFEGEGESWRETRALRLLADGRLRVTGRGDPTIRVRCAEDIAAVPPPAMAWDHAASGEGDGLTLAGPDGRRLTLFCPAGADELIVNVPTFEAVASEERMSFGAGGTVVLLVADFRGDRRRGGVTGTGPVPDELATILAGEPAVNYGFQDSGPHPRPPAALAEAFVAGCRD